MDPDSGEPDYPWGPDPWPGTHNIKDNLKNHPEAKDGYYFNEADYGIVMKKLQKRADTYQDSGGKPSEAKKSLQDVADLKSKDFGQWLAADSLYRSVQTAHTLMLGAYENFTKAYAAVLKRIEDTHATNTGVEVDNIETVSFDNVQTIDPPKPDYPA
ncbi:hypothetical protein [Actinoallomurus acaciae]|uniref:Uncharacterized protein n=1 Tax=Actinoallomurus acaciae TaxID=502577 RepID=A0ABV5YBY0_9ACTN